jgi:LysR family transcriptional regulator, transcriptional activator of the cysJI operon
MYIDSFKVFCDLVSTASFSKAAEKNKITQSAVSQQVRTLEMRFGVSLVDRSRRNVSLTPEGTAFFEACSKIIEIWDDFESELGTLKNEVTGELKVAAAFTLGLYRLPASIKKFNEKHPGVVVRMAYGTHDEVCAMVADGDAALGVIAFPTKRKELLFEEFGEDELVIIVAPGSPLAKRTKMELSDLNGLGFAAFSQDSPTRKLIDRSVRDAGAKVVLHGNFESVETIKRVVQIENIVSIVPLDSVRAEVAAGTLVKVAIDGERLVRPLGAVISRSRSRPPGLKEFLKTLKN